MFALPIFMYTLLGAAIALASPAPAVNELNARSIESRAGAYGANCNGNPLCLLAKHGASDLVDYIDQIPDNKWFGDGDQIACTSSSICAFLQGSPGSSGYWLKTLAHYLKDNAGCKTCGSVAYLAPNGVDDSTNGELTFNKVEHPCNDNGGPC